MSTEQKQNQKPEDDGSLVFCDECGAMRSERIAGCFCGATGYSVEPEAELIELRPDDGPQLHLFFEAAA